MSMIAVNLLLLLVFVICVASGVRVQSALEIPHHRHHHRHRHNSNVHHTTNRPAHHTPWWTWLGVADDESNYSKDDMEWEDDDMEGEMEDELEDEDEREKANEQVEERKFSYAEKIALEKRAFKKWRQSLETKIWRASEFYVFDCNGQEVNLEADRKEVMDAEDKWPLTVKVTLVNRLATTSEEKPAPQGRGRNRGRGDASSLAALLLSLNRSI